MPSTTTGPPAPGPSTTSRAALVAPAAAPILEIVRGLETAALDAPTPCAGFAVRDLLHHLLFWGPVLESAARKQATAPPAASEADLDLVVGDWRSALDELFHRQVSAWSDPAAWDGSTSMGGPDPLPAGMVGAMAVGELVVHGWDLGRAVGLRPDWDEDVLEFLHREVSATAEMGRQLGAYGAEVPVGPDAPALDRLLGAAGRDPAWTA